jgi:hypothetical protein
METPFLIWLGLSVVLFILAVIRPEWLRYFAGLFFIVMALGVNLPLLFNAPEEFGKLGSESFIPVYRQLFQAGVAPYPALFVVPVILFELATGLMMLGRGMTARIGVFGAIGFLSATAPLNIVTLPNLVAAAAFVALLWSPFDVGLVDIIAQFRRRWQGATGAPTR